MDGLFRRKRKDEHALFKIGNCFPISLLEIASAAILCTVRMKVTLNPPILYTLGMIFILNGPNYHYVDPTMNFQNPISSHIIAETEDQNLPSSPPIISSLLDWKFKMYQWGKWYLFLNGWIIIIWASRWSPMDL